MVVFDISVFETTAIIKICKFTVFSPGSFCQIYRVNDKALIAETMVWTNFFLMNVFSALKGSKKKYYYPRFSCYSDMSITIYAKILRTSHDHRHPLRDCITSSTSNIISNIYLKGLRALSRGLLSLTNELAPTYRARNPHGPSASLPYVPSYGVEYLQGASAPFSCFYDNTRTDASCCCCCCCQYKLSAGSRKE